MMNNMTQLISWFQLEYPSIVAKMKKANHHLTRTDKATLDGTGIVKVPSTAAESLNPYHCESDVFTHTMMVCKQAENDSYEVQIAALLHDIGKPSTRKINAKKNNGIDWKALSHATRVSIQGLELLNTGKITLPLNNVDGKLVKEIKAGNLDYKDVSQILTNLLGNLEAARLTSKLPEEVSKDFTDEILIKLHRGELNELQIHKN